ncbi:glycosyltransferase [Patescibacteria group bacterium]|nr:glycosyltransferase [Patescibacteria group bacterium]
MKIGIDISQTLYENTGVGNYLTSLVQNLLDQDKENEYILFFSSLRRGVKNSKFSLHPKVKIRTFKFPPLMFDLLWNKLHIAPIEWFIGDIDVFITSDWTEPPTKKAKKATIIYDLIIYKHPEETDSTIVKTQKKKLKWVKKESDLILTISESSKKDIHEILNIPLEKIKVVYPGV